MDFNIRLYLPFARHHSTRKCIFEARSSNADPSDAAVADDDLDSRAGVLLLVVHAFEVRLHGSTLAMKGIAGQIGLDGGKNLKRNPKMGMENESF
jgi:hypothetical protein